MIVNTLNKLEQYFGFFQAVQRLKLEPKIFCTLPLFPQKCSKATEFVSLIIQLTHFLSIWHQILHFARERLKGLKTWMCFTPLMRHFVFFCMHDWLQIEDFKSLSLMKKTTQPFVSLPIQMQSSLNCSFSLFPEMSSWSPLPILR